VRERLHLVDAVRLDPQFVATVGDTYRQQFTRNVDGVEVLPLVVPCWLAMACPLTSW